ncbi:MAG: hypothetical protein NVSMB27_26950 [Ktedonobacteraceae bacterium]
MLKKPGGVLWLIPNNTLPLSETRGRLHLTPTLYLGGSYVIYESVWTGPSERWLRKWAWITH